MMKNSLVYDEDSVRAKIVVFELPNQCYCVQIIGGVY